MNQFLSVVIPAYNEEKRIVSTLKSIDQYLKKQNYEYEIIVVSDGSKDKTVSVVNDLTPSIRGLSKGVLIVEADQRSGALITAQLALDYNRDIFAIPGSIFSSKSIGTNKLIQKGAKLITSVQDIIEEYDQDLKLFEEEKINISTKDPTEKKILDILDGNSPLFIDDIVRELKIETSKVIATLSIMEISGKVKNIGSGKYKKM